MELVLEGGYRRTDLLSAFRCVFFAVFFIGCGDFGVFFAVFLIGCGDFGVFFAVFFIECGDFGVFFVVFLSDVVEIVILSN